MLRAVSYVQCGVGSGSGAVTFLLRDHQVRIHKSVALGDGGGIMYFGESTFGGKRCVSYYLLPEYAYDHDGISTFYIKRI